MQKYSLQRSVIAYIAHLKQQQGCLGRRTIDQYASARERYCDLDLWTHHFENVVRLPTFSGLSLCDLHLWPYDLVNLFSNAMPTQVTTIFAKFHSNPSTKWINIASQDIGVNGQRTDGQLNNV